MLRRPTRRALLAIGLVLALLAPSLGLTHAHSHGAREHCAVCKTLHAPAIVGALPALSAPLLDAVLPAAGRQRQQPRPAPRPASRGPPHFSRST